MFDLPQSIQPTTNLPPFVPVHSSDHIDSTPSFVLTLPCRKPLDLMAGRAAPLVLGRFETLAEAMRGAIAHAEALAGDDDLHLVAILDRDERLVLAGAARDRAVAWCHPVASAADARGVVAEACQLRSHATRAADWGEPSLARRLGHYADLLDARLVDPLWRAFAARTLQVAA